MSMRGIIILALVGSVGFGFLFGACAPQAFGRWWPMFVLIFYALVFLTSLLAFRMEDNKCCRDFAVFAIACFVASCFSLPMLLVFAPTAAPAIKWGPCVLTQLASILIIPTLVYCAYLICGESGLQ